MEGNPQLRIAVDFRPVRLSVRSRRESELAGGAATLRVSRMEPLVAPGEIWATESFRDELAKRPSLYGAVEIEGGMNLKKPGSREEDTFVRAFRVGPSLG